MHRWLLRLFTEPTDEQRCTYLSPWARLYRALNPIRGDGRCERWAGHRGHCTTRDCYGRPHDWLGIYRCGKKEHEHG